MHARQTFPICCRKKAKIPSNGCLICFSHMHQVGASLLPAIFNDAHNHHDGRNTYSPPRKRSQALRTTLIYFGKHTDVVVYVLETLGLDGEDHVRLRQLELC